MAKVKGLKSFAGKVSMRKNEVKDIQDKDILKDLVKAGYVEEIKTQAKKTSKKKGDE